MSRQGRTLRYVDIPQTEAMCWAAIKNDPTAFQYVHHQTKALSLAAVQGDGGMLFYVAVPTYAIRLAVQNCLGRSPARQPGVAVVQVFDR